MKNLIKSVTTCISTIGLVVAGFAAPAQATGPEINLVNTDDTLQGSSISGHDPDQTLTLSVITESGTLTWQDSGTSGASAVNNVFDTAQGLFFTGNQDQLSAVLNELTINKPCGGAYKIYAEVTDTEFFRHPVTQHLYKRGGWETLDAASAIAQYTTLVDGETHTRGYVATITDSIENEILRALSANTEILLAASDRDVEGDWKWVSGPETGQSFYFGDANNGGYTLLNKYSSWFEGEPNDSNNEDYVVTSNEGGWNDIGNDMADYVIEFGGMDGDDLSSIEFTTASLDIEVSGTFVGSGTEANPFLVPDAATLDEVRDSCGKNAHFKQTADIDLPSDWSGDHNFVGHYEGDDYTISFAPGTEVTHSDFGIWGSTTDSSSTIRDLHVTGDLTGSNSYRVGLLVGENRATISDVTVDGSITLTQARDVGGVVGGTSGALINVRSTVDINVVGEAFNAVTGIGGIAGYSYESIDSSSWSGDINISGFGNINGIAGVLGFADCANVSNTASVGSITIAETLVGDGVGGVVGNQCGEASNVTADVDISAPTISLVGGFAGNASGNLSNLSATGNVEGDFGVGGLVGRLSAGLQNSYARGNVVANYTGGSLAGILNVERDVKFVYATGTVTAASSRGLFGEVEYLEVLESAHWVVADSTVAQPENLYSGEVPFSAEESKSFSFYQNDGWEIEDTWTGTSTWSICSNVNDGYPYLGSSLSANPCTALQTLKPTPTISGSGVQGSALTGTPGTWDAGVTLVYAWLVDGQVIAGSTTTTYTPQVVDVDKTVTFRVTSTRSGYVTEVKTSVGKVITAKPVPPVVPPVVPPKKPVAKPIKLEVVIGGFAGNAWWIPAGFVSTIKKAVKAHGKATTVKCIGIVAPGGSKSWLKKLGLKRAELACAFVKANNKKLKLTLAWKVAKKGEKVQRGAALKFNK